jgi:hypothetical protein
MCVGCCCFLARSLGSQTGKQKRGQMRHKKRKVEAEKSSNGTSKVQVAEFVCYVRTSTYYVSRE